MKKFCLVVAALAATFVSAGAPINFHFFHTQAGLVISVKRYPTLADTYVDVRDWGMVQWSEIPDLTWSILRSGHEDVIPRQPMVEAARRIEVESRR